MSRKSCPLGGLILSLSTAFAAWSARVSHVLVNRGAECSSCLHRPWLHACWVPVVPLSLRRGCWGQGWGVQLQGAPWGLASPAGYRKGRDPQKPSIQGLGDPARKWSGGWSCWALGNSYCCLFAKGATECHGIPHSSGASHCQRR